MFAVKSYVVVVLFCASFHFSPSESTRIIHKITGFVRDEAEFLRDSVKDAVNAVHDVIFPHHRHHPHHFPPVNPEPYPHNPHPVPYPHNPHPQPYPYNPHTEPYPHNPNPDYRHLHNPSTDVPISNPHFVTAPSSASPPSGTDNSYTSSKPRVTDDKTNFNPDDPNLIYDIDIRNNVDGIPGNSVPTKSEQIRTSVLSFKTCPEGQRKDRSGTCRYVD